MATIRAYCPRCRCEQEILVIQKEETYPVKGEPITIAANVCICTHCCEEIMTLEYDDDNLRRAYAIYQKRHGHLWDYHEEFYREGEKNVMDKDRKHISDDLWQLWCCNVNVILKILRSSHVELAVRLGVSRQWVDSILSYRIHSATPMQFHATMRVLDIMINEVELPEGDKCVARQLWTKVDSFSKENGVY